MSAKIIKQNPQARKWVKCKTEGCETQIRPRIVKGAELCKVCQKKVSRKAYAKSGAKTIWAANIRMRFGLTVSDYERILAEQSNLCKICKRPQSRAHNQRIDKMCVDHCHVTGIVRGLLCSDCNCMLGYAQDSIPILQEAIQYLNKAVDLRSEILEKGNSAIPREQTKRHKRGEK